MNTPRRKWMFFVPLILGLAVFAILKRSDPGAEQVDAQERATAVRVLTLPVLAVAPRVTAFGNVVPATVLSSVAEVSGEVVYAHPKLSDGELVRAGDVLLRIDPVDYELSVAQAQAQVSAAEIRLAEFDTTESSNRSLLALDQEALEISERELSRLQGLLKKGTVSRSAVDTQMQSTLARRQSVQTRNNTLAELPGQRGLQAAELARTQALLEQAQRDLLRTEIIAPFDGRIASVAVEQGQYVRVGDKLMELDAIDRAEVSVQVPMSQMADLVSARAVNTNASSEPPQPDSLISAELQLDIGGELLRWPAKVIRLSDQVDSKTRTVGLIVSVDGPYENVRAGQRPPLVKGMFVQVELQSKEERIVPVVPRNALNDGRLLVVDEEQRLRFQPVDIWVSSEDYIAFTLPQDAAPLDGDMRVIISDVVPAIEGMLVNPVEDSTSLAELTAAVSGEVNP